MPATVLIVDQEPEARDMLLAAIRAAGYEVASFDDPMTALDALEADRPALLVGAVPLVPHLVRVLVTRVIFGPGNLNGVALAHMLRNKLHPVRFVFVGPRKNRGYVDGLGEFVPHPLDPQAVVEAVERAINDSNSGRGFPKPAVR